MGGLLNTIRGAVGRMFSAQGDPSSVSGFDENKTLKFTQDRWNDLKNAYIVYHQSIWQALLFYANQSWIDWDDARKVWQPQQPTDEWVPRPRINRFSPTVDAVASNIYQVPEVEAQPKPDDSPEATMVAEVATRLAEWFMLSNGLKRQRGDQPDKAGFAAQLFVLCGGLFSILRVKDKSLGKRPIEESMPAWNVTCPNCDVSTRVPQTGEAPVSCPTCGGIVSIEDTEVVGPKLDEKGQPIMQEASEKVVECYIGNNLYAFPRPGATSLDDTPYLLWAQRHPIDTIWHWLGFEAQPDAIWPDGYSVTYEHALNFWYTGYSSSAIQVKDSCMVLEMYVPPNKLKDIPDGYYNVIINDKLAYAEQWSFPEHPLTIGYYLNLPTIFFPRSVAFDLVEIQRELNAYESVIKLHAMTSAVDPIVLDANTLVSEVTGRADRVIKWRSIGPNSNPPHRLSSGHLDDGIYKQRDNLHAEFQNISMAVNAFRGEQEGAITAASAIQQLRSQAELMFSKPVSNWNNFWCETVRKGVKFMQRYCTLEQIARICGPDREVEINAFMQANLDLATEWVTSTHGLPKTRDERRQELMALWDKGALDINQPEVRQKVYELFGATGMMRSFNKDATNARLENQAFKSGATDIHPMPMVEDLAVHLYFHKDQAKSQDFKKWEPAAQQALLQHILETAEALGAQAMAAAGGPPAEAGSAIGNKNIQGQKGEQPIPVEAAQ